MITLFVPYIHKVDKEIRTSIKPDRSRILIYTPDIFLFNPGVELIVQLYTVYEL